MVTSEVSRNPMQTVLSGLNTLSSLTYSRVCEYPESEHFWMDADEAFMFLGYLEEYNALFVEKTRTTARYLVGHVMQWYPVSVFADW